MRPWVRPFAAKLTRKAPKTSDRGVRRLPLLQANIALEFGWTFDWRESSYSMCNCRKVRTFEEGEAVATAARVWEIGLHACAPRATACFLLRPLREMDRLWGWVRDDILILAVGLMISERTSGRRRRLDQSSRAPFTI